ncbi:MAG: hypothetical protein HRF45_04070 [Fimbriimonadia bacterium]
MRKASCNRKGSLVLMTGAALALLGVAYAALVVPTDIQQPGTQPGQVNNLESPDKCDNCHGGYDSAVEPEFNWRGGMMAMAGRDPIFWATMAIAEQDFDGAGDLCLRCHSADGWIAGRSTPTDGSGLQSSKDADGVSCDTCHKFTNPDNSEHVGVQTAPFIANDGQSPATAFLGSGMYVLWGGAHKLGPYSDANARHQWLQSRFHRSSDLCGTCHDVSNPAVGDLAHNNGAQQPLEPGKFSGVPGSPVQGKAAFNNFPFMYGIVERTFSEHKSSALSNTRMNQYASLPAELKAGAIKRAYDSAVVARPNGDYVDGTPRYFTCQSCHMRPVQGMGCNKSAPFRNDLPLHDQTGGNYWMPDAIEYLDSLGKLRIGGGLTARQKSALDAGKLRALDQLGLAASLKVQGNTLRVVNLTGHKLISGYPEGRRMWLNIEWYSANGTLLREDGAYGPIAVTLNGVPMVVESLIDPYDPNTKVYEAHYAMTKEWAAQLLSLGYPASLPLSFDRYSGLPDMTLGQLAAGHAGSYHETFHFVLNNFVAKDNRIPPYGFSYDEAKRRNALPVPADQYGNPGVGGTYRYWDEVTLKPPTGAVRGVIRLMYQPTSWEYIQFLYLANTRQIPFLANVGTDMLNAWLNTGMAAPVTMATTEWTNAATAIPANKNLSTREAIRR